ncbi:hypothetical protein BDW22DRAFT_1387206 [Trametopsis cervina]|nr:hypothetical protein BDW22DRAFT_1387206 [Trametopsis cervina]
MADSSPSSSSRTRTLDSTLKLGDTSSAAASSSRTSLCTICLSKSAVYTCPRCQVRTCSLPCSTAHKTQGEGCSGIRNKAAYIPMNQYGYMALMDDYTFLEDVGRKIGDWGKEIVVGGYQAGSSSATGGKDFRGRGRGRGRGGSRGRGRGGQTLQASGTRSKRDVLKMELDFLDIEMEQLPVGMERRILNQSTWDFNDRTALLTIEFVFQPPRFLSPTSPPPQPIRMLTHRNRLDRSLMTNLSARLAEQSASKKKEKPLPEWIVDLIQPHSEDPDAFVKPICAMRTKLDPLASLSSSRMNGHAGLRPGHVTRKAFYRLDYTAPLTATLKHKDFVEFPTIEVWEDGSFEGIIVDDHGALVRRESDLDDEIDGGRARKRRKMGKKEGKKALGGLLGGYGSDSQGSGEEATEEKSVFNMLSGYAGSDDEGDESRDTDLARKAFESQFDYELGDEDAEGETDEEYEEDEEEGPDAASKDPEALAKLLQELRQAGALRGPRRDGPLVDDEEQVDWGDSGDER